MKWLIVGLGSIGRRHLRNLLTMGQKDIILYRTHSSTLPDEELAHFPVETDLIAALSHNPDAAIIANPTAFHLQAAIPAAASGCHILLEKPIAAEMNEKVKLLQNTVAQTGIKTLVGFQFRFHPVLEELKEAIASGIIGKPLSFRAHWGEYLPGWHPWEDYRLGYAARRELGGGVVNTLCHPLDYVRWLFGEVDSLFALTDQVSDLELDVEDVAEITLKFDSGLIGSIHLDYFQQPGAHWLEVNGTQGHIYWDNETGVAKIYLAHDKQMKSIEPPLGFERNQMFLLELQHFMMLIGGRVDSRCNLDDGIKSLILTEAVHESAKKHSLVKISKI